MFLAPKAVSIKV